MDPIVAPDLQFLRQSRESAASASSGASVFASIDPASAPAVDASMDSAASRASGGVRRSALDPIEVLESQSAIGGLSLDRQERAAADVATSSKRSRNVGPKQAVKNMFNAALLLVQNWNPSNYNKSWMEERASKGQVPWCGKEYILPPYLLELRWVTIDGVTTLDVDATKFPTENDIEPHWRLQYPGF